VSRQGRIFEIASLSVVTGIAPNDLLECDPAFLIAIKAILNDRQQHQKAQMMKRGRRR
jgi:hypothetical protein